MFYRLQSFSPGSQTFPWISEFPRLADTLFSTLIKAKRIQQKWNLNGSHKDVIVTDWVKIKLKIDISISFHGFNSALLKPSD